MSIYTVFPRQIILHSTTKLTTNQYRESGSRRGWSHALLWRLSKPPLPTTNTHIRSTATNRRKLSIDDMERSLPIWIYWLLWTIPETTAGSLTEKDISEIDYTHTQNVFNHFNMTDLRDYHNIYLLTNVLLLAKMFKNFRDVYPQHYGLDSAHNFTSPGLSWQAALKMTDIGLDLLTDIDQHLFIREGIRGGVVMISHRYAWANNPGLENYDASKRNS